VHQAFTDTLAELGLGMGKLGPAIRVAITGTAVSPAIDQTVYLCGRAQALARLQAALAKLP
jgi:glutamyl-tRNA synthetase